MNEIETLRRLKHPNILILYEVYEAADFVHLVLEYLKGGELFDKIQEKGSYCEGDAAKVMKKLLETINYCHSLNIIHRDIKPENIILQDNTSDLDFKIVDFGLAVISAPGKKETLRCGSPGYAAPEVLLKEGYDLKADIFSCGIIMAFLLTGTTPFASATIEEIVEKNKLCKLSMDTPIWKKISSEAKDLLSSLTKKNPNERITSGEALKHKWFSTDLKKDEILSEALENMRRHSGSLKEIDLSKVRPDFGKLSLLTMSPLLGGKRFDFKDTDSPIHSPLCSPLVSPTAGKKHKDSNPFLNYRLIRDQEQNVERLFPHIEKPDVPLAMRKPMPIIPATPSPMPKPKHEPSESSSCAVGDDELTAQISVPEFRPRTNSIKTINTNKKPENSCRDRADSDMFNATYKGPRKSVNFPKRKSYFKLKTEDLNVPENTIAKKYSGNCMPHNILEEDEKSEDITEFPLVLVKTKSQAISKNQDLNILEDEKQQDTERLPLSSITVCKSDDIYKMPDQINSNKIPEISQATLKLYEIPTDSSDLNAKPVFKQNTAEAQKK